MLRKVFTSIFGSRNDRVVKRLGKVVTQINALEPDMEKMRDVQKKLDEQLVAFDQKQLEKKQEEEE